MDTFTMFIILMIVVLAIAFRRFIVLGFMVLFAIGSVILAGITFGALFLGAILMDLFIDLKDWWRRRRRR